MAVYNDSHRNNRRGRFPIRGEGTSRSGRRKMRKDVKKSLIKTCEGELDTKPLRIRRSRADSKLETFEHLYPLLVETLDRMNGGVLGKNWRSKVWNPDFSKIWNRAVISAGMNIMETSDRSAQIQIFTSKKEVKKKDKGYFFFKINPSGKLYEISWSARIRLYSSKSTDEPLFTEVKTGKMYYRGFTQAPLGHIDALSTILGVFAKTPSKIFNTVVLFETEPLLKDFESWYLGKINILDHLSITDIREMQRSHSSISYLSLKHDLLSMSENVFFDVCDHKGHFKEEDAYIKVVKNVPVEEPDIPRFYTLPNPLEVESTVDHFEAIHPYFTHLLKEKYPREIYEIEVHRLRRSTNWETYQALRKEFKFTSNKTKILSVVISFTSLPMSDDHKKIVDKYEEKMDRYIFVIQLLETCIKTGQNKTIDLYSTDLLSPIFSDGIPLGLQATLRKCFEGFSESKIDSYLDLRFVFNNEAKIDFIKSWLYNEGDFADKNIDVEVRDRMLKNYRKISFSVRSEAVVKEEAVRKYLETC